MAEGDVGAPRELVLKSGFRIEIDGCGDLRLETCGELMGELAVIEIYEGGKIGLSQHFTGRRKYPPVDCARPLDLKERRVAQWWSRTNRGIQDHRNGTFFYVVAGEDVAKKEIRDIVITKHKDAEGDAKSEEDLQMETFTLKFKELGDIEVLV